VARTVVHLLRHGEVDNPTGILYGRLPDFHLSEAGRGMADAASAALSHADVVEVVSSPLERAQETAGPVARRHSVDIATDDRLIEAGNRFEGKKFGVGDGSLARPENWMLLVNPFKPSWGEPYDDIAERMVAAVADARDRAHGHETVLVSHQLPIWTVRRFVEGRHLWHNPAVRQCSLASLTSLVFDDASLVSVVYTEPAGEAARRKKSTGA